MTKTKQKRNRSYQPKPIRLPSLIPVISVAEADANKPFVWFGLFTTLIERPSLAALNMLSMGIEELAGALYATNGRPIDPKSYDGIALNSAILAQQSISRRHDRTGVVSVTPMEANTLRLAAGKLEPALNRIPVTVWNAAMLRISAVRNVIIAEMLKEAA